MLKINVKIFLQNKNLVNTKKAKNAKMPMINIKIFLKTSKTKHQYAREKYRSLPNE